ncbi:hypothetical protein Btru_076339 [Bulinus truncatus]|nr:hypothetical protein Btru_076339 [Bulinus truncatus]
METFPVIPLTCDEIECQNNNVCQVSLANGTQLSDAKCKCQGQWAGEKCQLRIYLSLLNLTPDSVTLHLLVKPWPPEEKSSHYENQSLSLQQMNDSKTTILVQNLNTHYQCLVLQQNYVQDIIQLQGLNKNQNYLVCLAYGHLDSCIIFDDKNITAFSNCVLFENSPRDIMSDYVGIIILCTTVTFCIIVSCIYIYAIKCNLLFRLLLGILSCNNFRKKCKRQTYKTYDITLEDSNDIFMSSELTEGLLPYSWMLELNNSSESIISHKRQYENESITLLNSDRSNTFLHDNQNMCILPHVSNHMYLRDHEFISEKENSEQLELFRQLNCNSFSTDTLVSYDLEQNSLMFPTSVSQYFNHTSNGSLCLPSQDKVDSPKNNSLCLPSDYMRRVHSPQIIPRFGRSHKFNNVTFSHTLPRTWKPKHRPLTLKLPSPNAFESDVTENGIPFKDTGHFTSHKEQSSMKFRFKKRYRSSSEEEEFRELQSPITEDRSKFSKKHSFMNTSSSMKSLPVFNTHLVTSMKSLQVFSTDSVTSMKSLFSTHSIFDGHPSEHNIPPLSTDDSYDDDADMAQRTDLDLFTDLSLSSHGCKDSILSYEDNTSNLITPFETGSSSDDDTYKDVDSLSCSVETLQA